MNVALLLGPTAELPRSWSGVPCYCGKTYTVEMADASRFEALGDVLPRGYPASTNWWAALSTPVVSRPRCRSCDNPATVVSRFYTDMGPHDIAFCKTHIQQLGATIDEMIAKAVFE